MYFLCLTQINYFLRTNSSLSGIMEFKKVQWSFEAIVGNYTICLCGCVEWDVQKKFGNRCPQTGIFS